MAQLYFYYGSMNSSKSASLLMAAHNYQTQGKDVILFTPAVDDRKEVGVISSRVGIESHAHAITEDDNLLELVEEYLYKSIPEDNIHCVFVDESQFLTREHVEQLTKIVDLFHLPVMCYGLKNDFQNNLFEGSEALLLYADKLVEIKTICTKEDCGKKATMNLRLHNGKPVYHGDQIEIGGDDKYAPVCRQHYYNFV